MSDFLFFEDGKKSIGILFGGASSEYEVSCVSAASVINEIDRSKYTVIPIGITKDGKWFVYSGCADNVKNATWIDDAENLIPAVLSPCSAHGGLLVLNKAEKKYDIKKLDCIFPVLHGETGEDGIMQGLLKLSNVAFVGCETRGAAITMDKAVTKFILEKYGVKQAPWTLLYGEDFISNEEEAVISVESKLNYPVFVKPANAGSSKGISKAKDRNELICAIKTALLIDNKIVIEQNVNGREIEVALLQKYNEGKKTLVSSVCGEVISGREFYDYEAKYHDDTSKTIVPADIKEEINTKIRSEAEKIFKALDCRSLSRADFFLSGDEIIFNEINAIPGFTSISMYPKLFGYMGYKFSDLIEILIESAIKEKEDE